MKYTIRHKPKGKMKWRIVGTSRTFMGAMWSIGRTGAGKVRVWENDRIVFEGEIR